MAPHEVGIILYTAPFHGLIQQCTLGVSDVLATLLAVTGVFQRLMDTFNVRHTALPECLPFALGTGYLDAG